MQKTVLAKDEVPGATQTHPWPSMRGSPRNDGMPNVAVSIRRDLPVRIYNTDNAIFSTPVIGANERIYCGSADQTFYAFDPIANTTLWTFPTDGVVDSAATLDTDGSVYVPCGDARLYKLSADGKEQWRLDLLEKVYGTSSSIFWWEGNAVVGPNGWIYAGNDDFCLYAIDPKGDVKWVMPTGMQIWSACAFADGIVYFSSFDMHVYAMHQETGEIAWTKALTNFASSSPALGQDGGLYVGAFDGMFTKLDAKTGRTIWTVQLTAAIYSSAALAPDGSVFIGCADGTMHRLSADTGATLSTFHAGSPIWSSVSIGYDPEHPSGYLAYFGASGGSIIALDPAGNHRWSYDVPSGGSVNPSPALGAHGFAIATGGGEVIYMPYDAYLREPGFRRDPLRGPPEGKRLYPLLQSGLPAKAGETIELPVGAPLMFGWKGETPAQTVVESSEQVLHRMYEKDRRLIVYPTTLAAGDERVNVKAAGIEESVKVRRVASKTMPRVTIGDRWRIGKMRFDTPAIITPFDQIGIASLSIDVGVVRHDQATGRFVAWGTQMFGMNEAGQTVGVPEPRHYVYAFTGEAKNGTVRLESRDCDFEITAFPLPLDIFALTATANGHGFSGTALYAELGFSNLFPKVLRRYWRHVRVATVAWIKSLSRNNHVMKRIMSVIRTSWAVLRLRIRQRWKPWGLMDVDRNLSAFGTYFEIIRSTPVIQKLKLMNCVFDPSSRLLTATFHGDARPQAKYLPGVMVLQKSTMQPVFLTYNNVTSRTQHGEVVTMTLRVPRSLDLSTGTYEAIVMIDTTEATTVPLR